MTMSILMLAGQYGVELPRVDMVRLLMVFLTANMALLVSDMFDRAWRLTNRHG